MGKIWILSPSPGGGCCGCGGKSGPCDGCCSGIFFNTGDANVSSGDAKLPIQEYDFHNCKVVSTIYDIYDNQSTNITLNVGTIYTGFTPYNNEIAIQLKKGQDLSIQTNGIFTYENIPVVLSVVGSPPPPHTSCEFEVNEFNLWEARLEKGRTWENDIQINSIVGDDTNVISGGSFASFGQRVDQTTVLLPPIPASIQNTGISPCNVFTPNFCVLPEDLSYIADTIVTQVGYFEFFYIEIGGFWALQSSKNFTNCGAAEAIIQATRTCETSIIGRWFDLTPQALPPVIPGGTLTQQWPVNLHLQTFTNQIYDDTITKTFTVNLTAKRDICFNLSTRDIYTTKGSCENFTFIEQNLLLSSSQNIPVTDIFFYTGEFISTQSRVSCPTA